MCHSYKQFELDPSSRPITTSCIHQRLHRSGRVTFDIKSTRKVFHEELRQTLPDIPNVDNIYDNILISGHNQAEHDLAQCQVLQRLANCRLTLKLPKCVFDKPRINFFGVISSHEGLAPAPEKSQALLQAPKPQSVAKVRSCLSMANLHFIRNFSAITAPS